MRKRGEALGFSRDELHNLVGLDTDSERATKTAEKESERVAAEKQAGLDLEKERARRISDEVDYKYQEGSELAEKLRAGAAGYNEAAKMVSEHVAAAEAKTLDDAQRYFLDYKNGVAGPMPEDKAFRDAYDKVVSDHLERNKPEVDNSTGMLSPRSEDLQFNYI